MERNKAYFPLFVDLSEKRILVVGGGKIAARRVRTLLSFCSRIKVVAPKISEEMQLLLVRTVNNMGITEVEITKEIRVVPPKDKNKSGLVASSFAEDKQFEAVICEKRKFMPDDLEQVDLVLVATNDPVTDEEIYTLCKQRNIPVNVASDKKKCDFYFPAIVQDENMVVGITSSGEAHKQVREMREKLEKILEKTGVETQFR